MSFDCCKNKKAKEKILLAAEFLKIIAEENRLQIICMLNKGERCVCEIWKYLDLPQNLISHHLKVLKDFELIKSKKEGTKVIYSINKKQLAEFKELINNFL